MTTAPTNPDDRRAISDAGSEMLTLQEACAFLRVPEGTLRYWRHLGAGPRSFKIGRHVRYWRSDLILWLTEQSNRPDRDR
jgi:predicted DNA-binding transcriptional regulator AlpA